MAGLPTPPGWAPSRSSGSPAPSEMTGATSLPALRFCAPGYNASDQEVEWLADQWGVNLIRKTSVPRHSHVKLAVARWLAERDVTKAASRVFADTGAERPILSMAPNPGREREGYSAEALGKVWFAMPNVHENDVGRARTAEQLRLERLCHHKWGECTCVPNACAIVSVHAAYYATPDTYAEQIIRAGGECSAFAVVNDFRGVGGVRYGGESHWHFELEEDGVAMISESVRGNHTPYRHPHPGWLFAAVTPCSTGHLVNKVLRAYGDTYVIETRWYPTDLPPSPSPDPEWETLTGRAATSGKVWAQQGSAKVESVPTDLGITKLGISSFIELPGSVLLRYNTRKRPTVISPAALSGVVAKMIGRVRDPAAHRDAVYYARRAYEHLDMPNDQKPEAINITAALALTYLLKQETEVLATVNNTFADAFRVHAQATNFHAFRVISAWALIALLGVAIAATIVIWAEVPFYHHVAGWVLIGALCAACIVVCVSTAARNAHLFEVGRTWTRSVRERFGPSVMSPTHLTAPLLAAEDTEDLEAQLSRPVREGGRVSIQTAADHPPPPLETAPRAVAEGLVVTDQVPVPPQNSLAGEVRGLVGRVLKDVPTITDEMLEFTSGLLLTDAKFAPSRDLDCHWGPDDRERWIQDQPIALQPQYRAAAARVDAEGILPPDFQKSAFVKIEKTAKDTDPRIIQALSDKLKVYLSPWLIRLSSVLRKAYDGSSGLLFASGRSSQVCADYIVGHWEQAVANFGARAIILDIDYSRYDCCCGRGFKACGCRQMRMADVDQDVISTWARSAPTGVTKRGVRYATEDGLCSGSPETSAFGSLWTAVTTTAGHILAGGLSDQFFPMVLGDDNNAVAVKPPGVDDEEYLLFLTKGLTSMGLIPEIKIHRDLNNLEFASKLYWPTAQGARRLGAKPGRAITRLGIRIHSDSDSNLAGDLIGLWQDNSHVPFLRVVIKHLRRLTSGQKAKVSKKRLWWEIHAPDHAEIHPSLTWTMTQDRYGLGEADEQDLDRYLAGVVALPSAITHRVITRLWEVDVPLE